MASSSIAALHAAIDDLAAHNLDTLADDELDRLVVSLQRARHRLAGVAAAAQTRWDARSIWSDDGSRSAATRLARDTSTSVMTARVDLRRARKLTSMPATHAAVLAGRLSMDHVDLLARANQPSRVAAFGEHEAMLVAECARLRFGQAQRLVDYWCQRVDADGCCDDARRAEASASLHASTTIDGKVVITGQLDRIGGAVFTTELARLERELYLSDQQTGLVRSPGQRRAAALVQMASRSASMPADARRPKALFTVLLGEESFRRMCELSNGSVVAPNQLVRYLGDADIESVLFDGRSTVVSVSHRRTFVGAVRRAIEVRDRHCQHPSGCDVPADDCDVDHIVPYRHGGETSQFDGRLECRPHNRDAAKHDHGAISPPSRPVDRLDELRCRIRSRVAHWPDGAADARAEPGNDRDDDAHAWNGAGRDRKDDDVGGHHDSCDARVEL